MSAVEGQRIAWHTVETLESVRNEESCNSFYDLVLIKRKQHPSISEPVLPRKRTIPARFQPGKAASSHPDTPRDHYRRIYYEAIDQKVSAINQRFDQPAFSSYAKLESLLLKATKSEDINTEMDFVVTTYHDDVNIANLQAQLPTLKVLLKESKLQCFQDVLEEIKLLPKAERALISEIITVCKLLQVNPATSATGERSFSTARRLKTWLRSQMLQSRFTNLAFLNTQKERLDKLCLVAVANEFVLLNENRQRNFGTFSVADFSRK